MRQKNVAQRESECGVSAVSPAGQLHATQRFLLLPVIKIRANQVYRQFGILRAELAGLFKVTKGLPGLILLQ
jgi:hypothetical protein